MERDTKTEKKSKRIGTPPKSFYTPIDNGSFNFIQNGKITVDDQIHECIEKKVRPSAERIGESLMDMGILYQAGQRAVMDGDDPVAAQKQIELGRFDLPLLLVHQRMNGNVNVIFKRFDFWALVLLDDIL